jgi:hypothetical protein
LISEIRKIPIKKCRERLAGIFFRSLDPLNGYWLCIAFARISGVAGIASVISTVIRRIRSGITRITGVADDLSGRCRCGRWRSRRCGRW